MDESALETRSVTRRGVHTRVIPFTHGWLFGGPAVDGSSQPGFDDSEFERITLPHSNTLVSWHDFDRSEYQYVSVYRRHFTFPHRLRGQRVFIDFEGSMGASTVTINGEQLGEYKGGYTPFSFELTEHIDWEGENVIAVAVDSRRDRYDVPPFVEGGEIDFDTFGGIYRDVSLRIVPETFIENVSATPVDVMDDDRRLDIRCYLDSARDATGRVEVTLRDDGDRVAAEHTDAASSDEIVELSLTGLETIELWDVTHPKLYDVRVRLRTDDGAVSEYRTRVGFRDARFERDGFYLNGRRLKIFGLNRHQLFPYVGTAMPERIQRRDAEILKEELNCNFVRTSHYVQSPAFMNACDELGLLVWDEMPGWGHVGDEDWQDVCVEHVETMIRRDWNHPSIVLWGVRVNEGEHQTATFEERLIDRAHELDASRQTTGALDTTERDTPLLQDVRGQNDYVFPDGDEDFPFRPPTDGEPYLVSEAVGQKIPDGSFTNYYRRTEPGTTQQARRHASAHNLGASSDAYAGVVAWCAFEYNSPINAPGDVKTPGVCDLFRIPKRGASFYRSQVDPRERVVLEPAFYWDFGPNAPREGPGEDAMICSNCERLDVSVGGEHRATVTPDRKRFPYLHYPPFFVDLTVDRAETPDLRIDGFVDDQKIISKSFSADEAGDRLFVEADDDEIVGDGSDMTRLVFRAVDRYGAPRPFVEGDIELELEGPGEIVGDNPFEFEDAGGAGAVWIRAEAGRSGTIRVDAEHPTLGVREAEIEVMEAQRREQEVVWYDS